MPSDQALLDQVTDEIDGTRTHRRIDVKRSVVWFALIVVPWAAVIGVVRLVTALIG